MTFNLRPRAQRRHFRGMLGTILRDDGDEVHVEFATSGEVWLWRRVPGQPRSDEAWLEQARRIEDPS